jgi:Tat protein secretion system quality control protein TatD with DNase activity
MIAVHCHLTFGRFERDRAKVIEQVSQQLEAVVISTTHPNDAKNALKLCQEYPAFLHATLGFHPVYASEIEDRGIENYSKFIKSRRAKLVGMQQTS